MNSTGLKSPFVAIACGGTGGHFFPGLAVAEQLKQNGCAVALLISPKDIDQQAVKSARGVDVYTLPAVGLQSRNYLPFLASFGKSLFAAWKLFLRRRPDAVLAMGGFTSAPPVFAGKDLGAKTFLHESNTIPGRSNRFVSRFVDAAFVGFSDAAPRLKSRKTEVTGTPVRPQFSLESGIQNPESSCRQALGLEPGLPTILVVGGSQGARGLNDLVLSALPLLKEKNWQWVHLTGKADFEKVAKTYSELGIRGTAKPFLTEMNLALGAATACISRAGASSLAEMAAMRLPSLLVPLPTAADNHQFFNALAFEKSGAARLLDQKNTSPENVAKQLVELVEDQAVRSRMQSAMAQWHVPNAAEQIARAILSALGQGADRPVAAGGKRSSRGEPSMKVVA